MTLACALCSGGSVNHGDGMLWFWLLLLGAVLIGIPLIQREERRKKAGLPLRGPATDLSPFTVSLLTGRNVAAYSAPVRSVTPGGIAVTYGQCCCRGHQSPAQAVAHAGRISQRIAATGR